MGELAKASGVARPTAYNALRALLERGEVQRVDLGGAQVGYRRAEAPQPEQEGEPEVDPGEIEPESMRAGS